MKTFKQKTIGVFFGGQSPEHEISIITGEFVLSELRRMGHNAVAIYVDRNGVWYSDEGLTKLKFFKQDYKERLKDYPKLLLDLSQSKERLVLRHGSLISKKKVVIDYIFPTFHGLGGEDGTIQGIAEFFSVPYAGCGIYASSLSIDKDLTKSFLEQLNIPTVEHRCFKKTEWESGSRNVVTEICNAFQFPLFVKPARAGSSIGISKVRNVDELEDAMNLAFYYDTKVLVEKPVENVVDLTCAVLSDGDTVFASEVQESVFESDLFDYSVKYLENGGAQTGNAESNLIIPANISEEVEETIKKYSKQIFNKIDANGMIRVDFLRNKKTGELFANEINTLPGTLYHHLWKKSGVEIDVVIERMLEHGLLRWNERRQVSTDFHTDVLNNANQLKLQTN